MTPEGLSRRQKRALAIVMAAPTIEAGCTAAGIARSTWAAWRGQESFRKAVEALEASLFEESMQRLRAGALRAQETLYALLASASEHVRLQAAVCLLRLSKEAAASLDFEKRLRTLEAQRPPVAIGQIRTSQGGGS